MADLIDRQAALNEAYTVWIEGEPFRVVQVETLVGLPSVQPTLYGYQIGHLAYIARIMQKEGVTPEYVARTLDDISRAVQMLIEEAQEAVRKTLNETIK